MRSVNLLVLTTLCHHITMEDEPLSPLEVLVFKAVRNWRDTIWEIHAGQRQEVDCLSRYARPGFFSGSAAVRWRAFTICSWNVWD